MGDDRDEKFDEKEMEKKEEKSPEEKNWDEKWRRDPLNAIAWAAIFIWAGLVLLAFNLGLVEGWFKGASEFPFFTFVQPDAWSVILIGAGVILLIEVVIRLLVPTYRKPVTGTTILGVVLIGIGIGNIYGWEVTGPFILIALGLAIILRGVTRRQ